MLVYASLFSAVMAFYPLLFNPTRFFGWRSRPRRLHAVKFLCIHQIFHFVASLFDACGDENPGGVTGVQRRRSMAVFAREESIFGPIDKRGYSVAGKQNSARIERRRTFE